MKLFAALLLAITAIRAAEPIATPYSEARDIIARLGPPELKSADLRAFAQWARDKDISIRARLDQGELDSMVNLLLFGTSFTKQPRMSVQNLAEESRSGLLRSRLNDFLTGLAAPGTNERLIILKDLLLAKGHQPGNPATGTFILENLQRSLKEKIAIAAEIETVQSANSAFRERGVSLDTTIFPNFAIDAALVKYKPNAVARAAIIGPGLDFIDKEAGFDYYPLQTLQPFALEAALKRLGLATKDLHITILDISPHVLDHIKLAKDRASKAEPYTIQLPLSKESVVRDYWSTFGTPIAQPAGPIPPPNNLANVETKAVRFPPSSVLALDAANLNIVTHRLDLVEKDKFDLIVATNILVYYDRFEQALAEANIAAMLKPGGILLTNDDLPRIANVLTNIASTTVRYTDEPIRTDTIYIYRR